MSASRPVAQAAAAFAAAFATAASMLAAACAPPAPPPPARLAAVGETAPVPHQSDDPAIWRHPTDPRRSLILGTDKIEAVGGLYAFGLDGVLRQAIAPLDRPNNVDVEYGVALGPRTWDIAVVTERRQHRLRLYGIDATGRLTDLAPEGLPVLEDETGTESEPMGIGVFRRPRDGAVFLVVSPKGGPREGYLAQYRLDADEHGQPTVKFVRRFGAFSGAGATPEEPGEIEAIVVDDPLGFVYYADEQCCLRKYAVDPDAPNANAELAAFGHGGYSGDREGLAILDEGHGRGFLVSVDQVPGGSALLLYPRQGPAGDPHRHELARRVVTDADATDGLDVQADLDTPYGAGLAVMMHDAGRSFRWFDTKVLLSEPPSRR